MAGIVERLIEGTNNIPYDAFCAALREYLKGDMTKAALVSGFSLSQSEQDEVDLMLTRITTGAESTRLTVEKIHDIATLAEQGTFVNYNTVAKCRAMMGL